MKGRECKLVIIFFFVILISSTTSLYSVSCIKNVTASTNKGKVYGQKSLEKEISNFENQLESLAKPVKLENSSDFSVELMNVNQMRNLSNNTDDDLCEKKTGVLLSSLINQSPLPQNYSYVEKFLFYSGWANDLGDIEACNKLNSAEYTTVTFKIPVGGFPLSVYNGICYFEECGVDYLERSKAHLISLINQTTGFLLNDSSIVVENPVKNADDIKEAYYSQFLVVVMILVFLSLVQVFHFIYRFLTKGDDHNNEGLFKKIITCFDFFSNAQKIITVERKTKVIEALSVFDGVRVLSIGYVILGHFVGFMVFGGISNPTDIISFFKSFEFAIVTGGYFAVDVFFYMSGFLFYLGLQKYLDKEIPRLKMMIVSFVSRYIRLLPLYLLAIFGLTYYLTQTVSGPKIPKKSEFDFQFMECTRTWWTNLLYLNNFIVSDNVKKGAVACVGVAWYLSNDMQFFVFSILVFITFNRNKMIRDIICFTVFLGSVILSFVLAYMNNFPFNDLSHQYDKTDKLDFMRNYYTMPYIRITPYLLGIYFCELFLNSSLYLESLATSKSNRKQPCDPEISAINDHNNDKRINLVDNTGNESDLALEEKKPNFWVKCNMILGKSRLCYIISVITCLAFINFAVFITVTVNRVEVSIAVQAIFMSINRLLFVGALGILLHLTFIGKLPFLRSILGFKLFTPLARITYGTFLIHMHIIVPFFFNLPSTTYFQFSNLFILAIGATVISYFFSFFLSLLLESPVINLLKKFIKGGE